MKEREREKIRREKKRRAREGGFSFHLFFSFFPYASPFSLLPLSVLVKKRVYSGGAKIKQLKKRLYGKKLPLDAVYLI